MPRITNQAPTPAASASRPSRIEINLGDAPVVVGHHGFHAADQPDVLDAAQAAELLAADEHAIVELAEAGELPGRRVAGHWRFARRALLDWLAAGAAGMSS